MNLTISAAMWRRYSQRAVRPWTEDGIKVDLKAIRILEKQGQPESTTSIANRWGLSVSETALILAQDEKKPEKPKRVRKRKPSKK